MYSSDIGITETIELVSQTQPPEILRLKNPRALSGIPSCERQDLILLTLTILRRSEEFYGWMLTRVETIVMRFI